jgi:predicted N-acetyltransferase YhbS
LNIRLLQREELADVWTIDRREVVENIYVLRDGQLALTPHNFDIRGWQHGEPELYTPMFLDCYDRGGTFWGAFEGDALVGTAILESRLIGSQRDTLQLKFLHVSRDYRKRGLGASLFSKAAETAKSLGAAKMYISATPSENTINFYRRLGCVLATEVDPELFALEPEDIHLECPI